MTAATHHLAQVNIMRMRGPLDGPVMAGFVAELDPVNALADASPGFVWRLQTEAGNATALRVFGDDRMIVNLSVWATLDDLWNFIYATTHLDVLRRRREWADRLERPHQALWWIPAGEIPTVADAEYRLDLLAEHGPTPDAFTFRDQFPAPAVTAGG
jgi:hypothetical protein